LKKQSKKPSKKPASPKKRKPKLKLHWDPEANNGNGNEVLRAVVNSPTTVAYYKIKNDKPYPYQPSSLATHHVDSKWAYVLAIVLGMAMAAHWILHII
jgi:hypothetical protein